MRFNLLHKEILRSISSLLMAAICFLVDQKHPYLHEHDLIIFIQYMVVVECVFIIASRAMPDIFDPLQDDDDQYDDDDDDDEF